ncbi:hypothetical protein RhoFasGS6_03947 [Rhodococcus fascians]|uniref:hypothetical protein n=1 Tax=Rhodococcoides fascians TaxID=1828 RepID=UPI001427CE6B|nr:hypothetical protein [Rhodococcus fascians]
MTKRRDLLKTIAAAAKAAGLSFDVAREGANHTVYDLDGLMIPVPRHREIGNRMAEVIWKQAAAQLGEDWWK